ncbi:uncharacterized protein UTRI_03218 [Ustilago trichophora]|uniref:Uncharacterized protein n=1 Tax=Ustilago trichophora TaxID=86804 RepID=A0A5C3E595_9BASI|nr:uncharacterized protein UTRI_03218 [Ustilago trichophora]
MSSDDATVRVQLSSHLFSLKATAIHQDSDRVSLLTFHLVQPTSSDPFYPSLPVLILTLPDPDLKRPLLDPQAGVGPLFLVGCSPSSLHFDESMNDVSTLSAAKVLAAYSFSSLIFPLSPAD